MRFSKRAPQRRITTPSGQAGRLSPRRLVAVGAAWSAVPFAVQIVAGLPVAALLVREMPIGQYGALASANALIALIALAGALGLTPAMARFGAVAFERGGDDALRDVTRNASRLARAAGIGVIVLLAGLAAALASTGSVRTMAAVIAVSIPAAALTSRTAVATGFLQVRFRPRQVASSNVTAALARVLVVVVAVVACGLTSAWEVAAALSLATIAGFIVLARGVPRAPLRWHAPAGTPTVRQFLSFGSAMVLVSASGLAISQLDVFLVGMIRGRAAAGLYAPASLLANQVVALAALPASFLIPQLAAAASRGSHRDVGQLYRWASRWALVLAAPAVGACFAAPSQVLTLIYGSHLRAESAPLRILMAGVLVHLAFGFNGATMDAYGMAKAMVARSGLGLAVSAISCAALIPTFGAEGAATATALGIAVLNVVASIALYRRHGIAPWDRPLVACLTAALLATGAVTAVLGAMHVDALVAVAIGAGTTLAPTLALSLAAGHGEDFKRFTQFTRETVIRRLGTPGAPS